MKGNLTITVARKPVTGTVASNALQWGTGGLNIDECRISPSGETDIRKTGRPKCTGKVYGAATQVTYGLYGKVPEDHDISKGRWPANLVLVHNADCKRVGTKRVPSITGTASGRMAGKTSSVYGAYAGDAARAGEPTGFADADGLETIDAWECEPTCPCRVLDEQTGVLTSGGKSGAVYGRQQDPVSCYGTGLNWVTSPAISDTGGASRFFKQVQADKGEE